MGGANEGKGVAGAQFGGVINELIIPIQGRGGAKFNQGREQIPPLRHKKPHIYMYICMLCAVSPWSLARVIVISRIN